MMTSTLMVVLGAVTVYVSPVGDDTNDGSEAKPLATVEAARNAVRKIRSENGGSLPDGGVQIVFEDGVYRLGGTLELGAEDSGADRAPVVWRARNRGKASISGFVELDWKPLTDEAVRAQLPDVARDHVLEADWPAGADMPGFRQSGCGLQLLFREDHKVRGQGSDFFNVDFLHRSYSGQVNDGRIDHFVNRSCFGFLFNADQRLLQSQRKHGIGRYIIAADDLFGLFFKLYGSSGLICQRDRRIGGCSLLAGGQGKYDGQKQEKGNDAITEFHVDYLVNLILYSNIIA